MVFNIQSGESSDLILDQNYRRTQDYLALGFLVQFWTPQAR